MTSFNASLLRRGISLGVLTIVLSVGCPQEVAGQPSEYCPMLETNLPIAEDLIQRMQDQLDEWAIVAEELLAFANTQQVAALETGFPQGRADRVRKRLLDDLRELNERRRALQHGLILLIRLRDDTEAELVEFGCAS